IDPVGAHRTATVDGLGRVTKVDDGATSTEFEYDELGRTTVQRRPDGTELRAAYDRCGRQVSVVDPLGGITRYAYTPAGRLARVTSPLGHVVALEYDRAGRMTAEVDPRGHRQAYRYDAEGRITRVSAAGQAWYFSYDEVGRPVVTTDQLGRTTRWEYDPAGQLTRQLDAAGNQIRWSYDPSGRLAGYQAGEAGPVTIERDSLARPTVIEEPGRRHQLAWDPLDRLITKRSGDLELTWHYDADGRQIAAGYPDGTHTTFTHDPAGGLTAAQHPILGTIQLHRDAAGRLTGLDTAGHSQRWTYRNGELVRFDTDRDGQRQVTQLERDAAGRVITETRDGAISRYHYDPAGQLTATDSPDGARTFGYDPAGRLTTETGPNGAVTYTYDAASQLRERRRGANVTQYAYDTAGQRVTETSPELTRTFTWNPLGHLTSIHRQDPTGESTTTVTVDAFGDLAAVNDTPLAWDLTAGIPQLRCLGDTTIIGDNHQPWATTDPTGAVTWLDTDWQHSTNNNTDNPWDPWGATHH
ncbi:MAG: hypothetical protein LC708_02835, partial [Actinobacteria bacterium]|nr:hypothetical protein [Actinomycetota bacterium]